MARARHLPGEVGIWVLVFFDLAVFGALFLNYAWMRSQLSAAPLIGLDNLDRSLGCFNTIILLSSSWFVAMAMSAVRDRQEHAARRFMAGALALGSLFVAIKGFEYFKKLTGGLTPETNSYFTYFFTVTGLHLFHLLVGMGVLLWMRSRMSTISSDRHMQHLESGATFWHMVDLLWIIIFPLLYLI